MSSVMCAATMPHLLLEHCHNVLLQASVCSGYCCELYCCLNN